jgi:hypothetical protein
MDAEAWNRFRNAGSDIPDPSLRDAICRLIHIAAYAENYVPANHYERRCIARVAEDFAILRHEMDNVADSWGIFPEREEEVE